ncbi:MAG: DNA replication/repair protein RecF [Alphaproteobacteria bacterium]|nr:MAG: DNA replication/repair protein RecF [Alphaproteobacteria bacterium]
MTQVSIAKLMLSAFRSYASAAIEMDARPVVLTGPNGAGKTNVLEALSLFAPGRGMRGARMSDLSRVEHEQVSDPWAISIALETETGRISLGTGLGQDPRGSDKRLVRIDGQNGSGPTAFADYLAMVWLTPAMDRLFQEGVSARRRFFDRLVAAHDKGHTTRYNAYEKAMRERQNLLERQNADAKWLDSLEATMAEHGVAVAAARSDHLARLTAQVDGAVGAASLFPRADLSFDCDLMRGLASGRSALEVEDRFAERLKYLRAIDRAAGRATEGAHRSDLKVFHRLKGMPAKQCSTGEQKALLIGIVLAGARLKAQTGAAPILLLDEIAAHLDEARRQALFDEICAMGAQAWMTGTDRALFDGFGSRAQYFEINESEISRRQ